jgi:hypothetical protein
MRLALSPFATYARLVGESAGGRFLTVRGPAFIALFLATLLAIASTGRPTLRLVLVLFVCWSFVPALQALAAWVVIAASPRRAVGRARALDLLFAGHAPWSLWLLLVTARVSLSATPPSISGAFLASAWIPLAWRCVIVFAFCRKVLGETRWGALVRTAAHQAVVWSLALLVLDRAVRIWPRLAGVFGG